MKLSIFFNQFVEDITLGSLKTPFMQNRKYFCSCAIRLRVLARYEAQNGPLFYIFFNIFINTLSFENLNVGTCTSVYYADFADLVDTPSTKSAL